MNKNEREIARLNKLKTYNADEVGQANGNLFGLPFSPEESEIVLVPVPWEATVSFGGGTANGPQAILDASPQLDLFDLDHGAAWQMGVAMAPIDPALYEKNQETRAMAAHCIETLENGGNANDADFKENLLKVNQACGEMNDWVYAQTRQWLDKGRLVGLVGGDHSTPLGFLKALSEKHEKFAILQIDAHADLRKAYEGFTYSHASIMFNALKINQINRLIQVGIRDVCQEEITRIAEHPTRVKTYFDRYISLDAYENTASWKEYCTTILEHLPEKVYISFDIDGLKPAYCPNTGTPVPGGLEFEQALYLIKRLSESGKTIIGFDLVEVGANEWDANVGARLLYRMCLMAAKSQKMI